MAKVKIYVEKAFKLLGDDGKHTDYPVGNHTVEKETAEHWFVKAHTGDEPPVDPEAAAAVDTLRVELEAEARTLADVAGKLNERQRELDEREKAANQLKKELQAGFEELRNLKAEVEGREKAADQRETDLNVRAEALDTREVAISEREKAESAAKQTGKK